LPRDDASRRIAGDDLGVVKGMNCNEPICLRLSRVIMKSVSLRGPGLSRTPRRAACLAALFILAAFATNRVPAARAQDDADATDQVFAPGRLDGAADQPAAEEPRQRGIPTTVSRMFEAGGWLMYPIAGCSIVALAFGIERMVILRRRRVIPRDFVRRFLEHLERGELDRAGALQLCEDNGSPVAEVFAHGVRKWGKPSVEVEQAIIDGGERQVSQLRSHLRILNGVSTIAPLLGLLGTVYGMITCFNEIANSSAMGKSEQLAGGIGVALITTAAGLTVAIPAMMLYMYFAGRVDALVMDMDEAAQKVVDLISAEGLASQHAGLPRIAPRPKTIGTAAVKNS
jgi:biopolymer transport protein ExbB